MGDDAMNEMNALLLSPAPPAPDLCFKGLLASSSYSLYFCDTMWISLGLKLYPKPRSALPSSFWSMEPAQRRDDRSATHFDTIPLIRAHSPLLSESNRWKTSLHCWTYPKRPTNSLNVISPDLSVSKMLMSILTVSKSK